MCAATLSADSAISCLWLSKRDIELLKPGSFQLESFCTIPGKAFLSRTSFRETRYSPGNIHIDEGALHVRRQPRIRIRFFSPPKYRGILEKCMRMCIRNVGVDILYVGIEKKTQTEWIRNPIDGDEESSGSEEKTYK